MQDLEPGAFAMGPAADERAYARRGRRVVVPFKIVVFVLGFAVESHSVHENGDLGTRLLWSPSPDRAGDGSGDRPRRTDRLQRLSKLCMIDFEVGVRVEG
jgi:hypothetical protein